MSTTAAIPPPRRTNQRQHLRMHQGMATTKMMRGKSSSRSKSSSAQINSMATMMDHLLLRWRRQQRVLQRLWRMMLMLRHHRQSLMRTVKRDSWKQLRLQQQLQEQEITLQATDAAKEGLAEEGYDPEFGARPLRRVIQRQVEDRLSEMLLAGGFQPGDAITVDVNEEGELELRVSNRSAQDDQLREMLEDALQ